MLEILIKRDGIVRTSVHTELAKYTGTEVVFISGKYFLLFPFFRFNRFGNDFYRVIGAGILT